MLAEKTPEFDAKKCEKITVFPTNCKFSHGKEIRYCVVVDVGVFEDIRLLVTVFTICNFQGGR